MPLPGHLTPLHTIGHGYLNDQIEGGGSTDLVRRLALALRGDTDLSELDDCFRSTETEASPKPAHGAVDAPSDGWSALGVRPEDVEYDDKTGIFTVTVGATDPNPTSHPARGWCYDVFETDEGATRTIWGALLGHSPTPLGDLLDPALKGVAALFTDRYGILHPEACDGSPLDYDSLDPGIRDIVKAFHAAGIPTTDSGDGVSKGVGLDITPFPHVVVPSQPGTLEPDADKVRAFVRARWADADLQPSLYEREDGGWGAVILVSWPPKTAEGAVTSEREAPTETCSNQYEPEKQAAWTSFWWESNAANGLIDSPARWTGLVHAYQEVVFPCVDPARLPEARRLAVQQMLDRGRLASRPGRPAFGTRAEHSGQTLREWAAYRGMSMVDVQG